MSYVNKLELHKLNVDYEFDYENQKFIEIYDLIEPLPWGKSAFKISIPNVVSENLTLKENSDLLFQLQDANNNDILVEATPIETFDGDALLYFWLKYAWHQDKCYNRFGYKFQQF